MPEDLSRCGERVGDSKGVRGERGVPPGKLEELSSETSQT